MNDKSNEPAQAPTGAPTLQQGIDQAGSAVHLLWKPNAAPAVVPVVQPEFTGWAREQAASTETVALADQAHHMRDLFITGPDATRLLADCSVNNYDKFAVGQGKQFVAVNEQGQYIADSILVRTAEDAYTLTGIPPASSWVLFHAEQGNYDVSFVDNLDSAFRPAGESPVLFRYQVQGPRALDLVERVFGGPLPDMKFFHSITTSLGGREIRALRHGMTGQPGYEFSGKWEDGEYVREALLKAGEEFDLVQVGGMAYYTTGALSGWIPTCVPAVYTDPKLKSYREWLGLYTFEGQLPLHGSFFSENIEDYYVSPFELGYGKVMNLSRDFPGRDALVKAKDEVKRSKVTVVINQDDLRKAFPDKLDFYLNFSMFRIEVDGKLVGITQYGTHIASAGTILFLSFIDTAHAAPGTEVTVVYGEEAGFGKDAGAAANFPRLRAVVQPAPYLEYARTGYRQD